MSWRCLQGGVWLERRQSGLNTAEGLQLEEHLAQCESCRRQADQLDVLRELISAGPSALAVRTRQRVIRNAITRAQRAKAPAPAMTPSLASWRLPAAGLCALGAALLIWLERAPDAAHSAASSPSAAKAPEPRTRPVLEAPPAPRPSPAELVATPGRQWPIGPARVRVERAMRLHWQEESASLLLGDAKAAVTIEAAEPGRLVRVVARNYIVEVSAAQFEVAPSVVTMIYGTARVLAPNGQLVLAELSPGQSWTAPAIAPESEASPQLSPPRRDVSAELRRARSLLAERRFAASERVIATALRARPTRPQRAEAQSLRAESALLAGHEARAQALYLQVADEYRELDASDNALFAAARIAQRRGRDAETRALLQRYLTRYPDGRFRSDAQRRLSDTTAR